MATDIPPLTPLTPTPLVREKRHYPGEEKDKPQSKKQKNEQNSGKDGAHDKEADKPVDIDEKDGTVRHIDEYA